MLEEKLKHLEFIQNAINRMNANSFQIKGWMITITAALLAILFASFSYSLVSFGGNGFRSHVEHSNKGLFRWKG